MDLSEVEVMPQAVGRGQRMDVMYEKSFLRTNWSRKSYFVKQDVVVMEAHTHSSPHWFSLLSGNVDLAIQQNDSVRIIRLAPESMYLVPGVHPHQVRLHPGTILEVYSDTGTIFKPSGRKTVLQVDLFGLSGAQDDGQWAVGQ